MDQGQVLFEGVRILLDLLGHKDWSLQILRLKEALAMRKAMRKRDAICANRLENRLNQTPRFQWLGWLIMRVDNDG